ncbi:MAG TPA: hypothetical protein VHH88_10910 [Verrucomicrobiae bacterium]|nr:hypothetical protein [Verrucomicrobiae bacterium]
MNRPSAMVSGADEPEAPPAPRCGVSELAPPDVYDPVLEVYKRDVDRTLLIENLKLTPEQRSQKFVDYMKFLEEVRQAGKKLRGEVEC